MDDKGLNRFSRQLLQRNIPKGGDQMIFDALVMGTCCGCAPCWPPIDFFPLPEPLSGCLFAGVDILPLIG